MARSSGYRANKDNREELAKLRARLAKCKSSKWQRATMIMQEIVSLTGKSMGPSGGMVEPRACKFCGYFGHTRQHCERRMREERLALESYMKQCRREDEERERERKMRAVRCGPSEEEMLDELGLPWERSKERWWMGAEVICGDGGHGKWVRVNGTVKMADE